jgi:hypothetical protein
MPAKILVAVLMASGARAEVPASPAELLETVRRLTIEVLQLRCAFVAHLAAEEDEKIRTLESELRTFETESRIQETEATQEAADLERKLAGPALSPEERAELLQAREEVSRRAAQAAIETQPLRQREQQAAARLAALQRSRARLYQLLGNCGSSVLEPDRTR